MTDEDRTDTGVMAAIGQARMRVSRLPLVGRTWEEAARCRQFRFRHIIDSYHPPIGWHLPGPLGPGEQPLLELEHETRAVRHFQFYKDVPFDG